MTLPHYVLRDQTMVSLYGVVQRDAVEQETIRQQAAGEHLSTVKNNVYQNIQGGCTKAIKQHSVACHLFYIPPAVIFRVIMVEAVEGDDLILHT